MADKIRPAHYKPRDGSTVNQSSITNNNARQAGQTLGQLGPLPIA